MQSWKCYKRQDGGSGERVNLDDVDQDTWNIVLDQTHQQRPTWAASSTATTEAQRPVEEKSLASTGIFRLQLYVFEGPFLGSSDLPLLHRHTKLTVSHHPICSLG
jgi:hypothetical protein